MRKIFIPPVLVFISIALIILCSFFFPQFSIISFPFNLGGLFLMIPGFALMGKSHELFKKHKTTLFIQKSSQIITESVFSKTRNPMYIGMITLLFGVSVCSTNLLSVFVPFVFLIIIRIAFIPVEERMMTETFGQEYINYKSKVRRWI